MQWNKFEDYVRGVMEEEHIAGAAIAVSQNGTMIYKQGLGVRDVATQEPVTPDTIFGIASVSKSFTAMAIMQLADEGKLSVEDPVIKHLPEFRVRGVDDMSSIKIHHLLSHTVGLPPIKRRQDIKTFAEHFEHIADTEYELLGEPGQYFSYANDMFLLLGAIIERLTGDSYRKYMTEHFLKAIGMNRSTYDISELDHFSNVSVPYVYNRKSSEFEVQPWPQLGTYEVGGGVRSNVMDLLKYGDLYVDGGMLSDRQFVSGDALRKMWQPVHKIDRASYYGYALKTTPDYHGVTLVEHGGGQPGVSSNFGFVPEKGIVVAVLTNVTGIPASNIWLAAVNTVLGLQLDEQRSYEPHLDMSAEDLRCFVGTYRSFEGGEVTVSLDNEVLYAENLDGRYELRASDERTFIMLGKPYKNVISFFLNNEGKAWAAFSGLRMLRKRN